MLTAEDTAALKRNAVNQGTTGYGYLSLRGLRVGSLFTLAYAQDPQPYEYYGEGWYGRPYSGGPWHDNGRRIEVALICGELKERIQKHFEELAETV